MQFVVVKVSKDNGNTDQNLSLNLTKGCYSNTNVITYIIFKGFYTGDVIIFNHLYIGDVIIFNHLYIGNVIIFY